MRKEIFGVLVLPLLIGGIYLLTGKGGGEPKGEDYSSQVEGVIQVTGLVERPHLQGTFHASFKERECTTVLCG